MRRRSAKLLSPVLSDEPLVGESLTRRLRIVLLAMLTAFFLTNVTSYLIGQAVRAEADRDTGNRVADLERKLNGELEERRVRRDAEAAEQEARVQQLRRDVCVALDRVQPRDAVVLEARKRYGCTTNPKPVELAPSAAPGARPAPGGDAGPGDADPAGRSSAGTQRPTRPPAPPNSPAPSPTRPPAGDDHGLICLPLLGCVL